MMATRTEEAVDTFEYATYAAKRETCPSCRMPLFTNSPGEGCSPRRTGRPSSPTVSAPSLREG